MADEHHGFAGVMFENESERVGRPRDKVLQRFAFGKPDQMRRRAPETKALGVGLLDLVMRAPLPSAVVQIVEVLGDHDAEVAAGARDVFGGRSATPHGAAIDSRGRPVSRNIGCGALGLPPSDLRQVKFDAPSEAFGMNAFDVAVTGQDQLGQLRRS